MSVGNGGKSIDSNAIGATLSNEQTTSRIQSNTLRHVHAILCGGSSSSGVVRLTKNVRSILTICDTCHIIICHTIGTALSHKQAIAYGQHRIGNSLRHVHAILRGSGSGGSIVRLAQYIRRILTVQVGCERVVDGNAVRSTLSDKETTSCTVVRYALRTIQSILGDSCCSSGVVWLTKDIRCILPISNGCD